ncbi:MAG: hypothetical protein ACXADB_02425 [Candidatus Hermodarchaeia archaeon]|jgi:hypothetical protein
MQTNIDISGGELREYVTSYRSVTFTNDGCRLRKKRGRVEFDFSWYGITKISVHLQRIGGNGKVIVSDKEFDVGSKVRQTFDIDTDGCFEICRPANSTGDVVLLGFTFSADKDSESMVTIDWKDIIRRCGNYSCLRLVKGKLFASTGGYIDGNLITAIETDPPNSATIESDKVTFHSSCEITSVSLSPVEAGLAPGEMDTRDVFVSRNPPTPINIPQPTKESGRVIGPNTKRRNIKSEQPQPQPEAEPEPQHRLPNFDDHILYDSSSVRNFKQFTQNNLSKQVRSNNKSYLIIKQRGRTRAAISSLQANKNYICIINGKKLNGNGRLYVGASIDDYFTGQAAEAMFGGHFENRFIQIRTGHGAPNSQQKLHLEMPERYCSGEVLIQRIIIVEDLGIDNARVAIEGKRYVPPSEVQRPESPEVLFSSNVDVRKRDKVYATSKKYALYPSIKGEKPIDRDIMGTIVSNNISGIVWSSRVKKLLKNVRVGDMKKEVGNDVLLVSHLGCLKPAKRIWIEPFEFDAKFGSSDANAVNSADVVLSPSLSNVQSLQEAFKDKRIELAHRPLPWVQPEPEKFFHKQDFVLTFERDRRNMEQLFRVWSEDLPTLVVVGARGGYPGFVIPLNEYYPYRKLLYLMKHARFIIDLPEICHYHSSILSLANSMGKAILSTNWYVLDKPNGLFVVRTNHDGKGRFTPSDAVLRHGVDEAMKVPAGKTNDMSNYNAEFLQHMRLLFS